MKLPAISNHWGRLSFRLPALIALFALMTGLLSGVISYYVANQSYVDLAKDRMELVRNERSRAVLALIDRYRSDLASLVAQPGVARDIASFSNVVAALSDAGRKSLLGSYTTANAFPAGSRSAVSDPGDGSNYTALHRVGHERYLRVLQIQELDDLLLVDARGNVVYSVAKEPDFGTNLLSGPYRATNAAKVFQSAIAAQPPWEPAFGDMEFYGPAERPALFMGQAVRDDSGAVVGVVLFQLNTVKLRDVANHTADLGETGEVYLVGQDATRRTQTRFAQGQLTTERMTNVSAIRAAAGLASSWITTNYKGDAVVAAYGPIDFMGVHWGIVSNIDLSEALAPTRTIVLATGGGVLLATVFIAFLGYASARRISRPLDQSLRAMDKLSRGELDIDTNDAGGFLETRQIASTLQAFRASLVESRRLVTEVTDSQEQLTGLLDSSPTGILVISSDNKVLFVNDPGASILGKRKSTFVGETFSLANIAVNDSEAGRIVLAARRDGVVREAQLAIRTSEGAEIVLSLSVRHTTFRAQDAYLIWFNDITDALRADRDLRDLSARFVTLLESTPDLITIKDRSLRFQAASQSVAKVAGLQSWRDLVGKTLAEAWKGDPAAVPSEAASAAVLAGEAAGLSEEHENAFGKDRWLSTRRVAIRSEDGEIVGVLSISRDITEAKRLQTELESALAEAKDARIRTDAILAGAPDPILIVQADGAIEYVNQRVQDVLGYSSEELVGQPLERLIPERFRPRHGEYMRGFFNEGHIRLMGAGRELFALAKDGHEIPVEIALSPIRTGHQPVVVALVRDITVQKVAEKAVRAAKEAAEAAATAKSEFLASMSHEIRTPMNGITGMADLLAQTTLDDNQKHMLRTIRESGNALITVINDILDFSKIEAGKLGFERVTMSVGHVVEGVASTLTPTATQKGIRVHVFVDPDLPTNVYGDPTRLRQILFNLGGNAVKFSDGKDVEIRATPAARSDDGKTWLRFSVIDHGIGMSKESQGKLFQAFSQAESSTTRRFGGTGLGLAICKRLIDMKGGTVTVDSEEGRGSTFTVELPFEAAEGIQSGQKERDLSDLHVLLVGSVPPRAEAIEAYIRDRGADVTAVPGAEAAVSTLSATGAPKFDSIMIDFDLDDGRQRAAIGAIRKAGIGAAVMIVLRDGQHGSAQIVGDDVVTVDCNPLIYYRLVSAVAVAAGRASPQIQNETDVTSLKPVKAPTVQEAEALGQLVLLVEDNPTNQDVIRRQLNLLGRACEIANNGQEGLKSYKTGRFGLILTDCHMPVMDGYELTGHIRAAERGTGKHIPVIAVTANVLQGEAERCLAAGMDDYVSKPIAMPALISVLEKWIPTPRGNGAAVVGQGEVQQAEAKPADAKPADAKPVPAARDGKKRPAGAPQSEIHVSANGSPAVDERAIKDMFGDDEGTFREILQSFIAPSRSIIEEMMAARQSRAAGGVADAAHKLKSSARSIGAHSLADICTALEIAGKAEDWPVIDSLAPNAHEEFGNVERFINDL